MSQIKENANPIIHSVTSSRRTELHIAAVEAFQSWQNYDEPSLVRIALLDSTSSFTIATNLQQQQQQQQHIKVLQNAGLQLPPPPRSIPSPATQTHRYPCFLIPSIHHRTKEYHEQQLVQRQLVTAEEVFDLIRTIQDPEHPLTLEQLNVVNPTHVTVHDSGDSTMPSTVYVRFT